MKWFFDWLWEVKWLLVLLLVMVLLIVGISIGESKAFNNGECQKCGEEVIPVRHQYTTDYYCPSCKRYNE